MVPGTITSPNEEPAQGLTSKTPRRPSRQLVSRSMSSNNGSGEPSPTSAAAAPASSSEEQTSRSRLQNKYKSLQTQLLLLIHAKNCVKGPSVTTATRSDGASADPALDKSCSSSSACPCPVTQCPQMKSVLAHLGTNPHPQQHPTPTTLISCEFPNCFSSRQVLLHWKNCRSGETCYLCGPLRKVTVTSSSSSNCDSSLSTSVAAAAACSTGSKRASPTPTTSFSEGQDASSSKRSKIELAPSTFNYNSAIPPENFRKYTSRPVWSGELEWHKQTKQCLTPTQTPLQCQIFSSKNHDIITNQHHNMDDMEAEEEKRSWPPIISKLCMRLIPTAVLRKIEGVTSHFTRDMDTFLVRFDKEMDQVKVEEEGEEFGGDVKDLKEAMRSGQYYGYVHFDYHSSSQQQRQPVSALYSSSRKRSLSEGSDLDRSSSAYSTDSEENSCGSSGDDELLNDHHRRNFSSPKLLILHYNGQHGTFTGLIPNREQEFIDKLRNVVHEEKTRLMEQQQQRQRNSTTAAAGTNSVPRPSRAL